MTHKDQKPKRQFYGRRLGRPLNESRRQALEALLYYEIPADKLTEQGDLDPSRLFHENMSPCDLIAGSENISKIDPAVEPQDDKYSEYWLEIGFGAGEHLAELMHRHPDTGFLGAEPFINGMSSFLKEISGKKEEGRSAENSSPFPLPSSLSNARVIMDDAIQLVHSIADESLDGIYILNPDPWHKKRHHKRLIVRPETLDHYARILKPGGQLILSTDVPDLADWMITHTYNHGAFRWTAERYEDWSTPPKDWITTAYEVKGAKGAKKMSYMVFCKL